MRKAGKSTSGMMMNDPLSLIPVEKDGELMYIDHSGTAVWEEQ